MTSVLDHVLAYAAAGRAVLPVDPVTKEPLTNHGLLDASTDPELLRLWWSWWPNGGVALVAGPGWWVLDVDNRDQLDDLENKFDFLPDTRRVGTPRGGLHYYFLGDQRTAAGVPAKGIDIRGGGKGYVVVPPTPRYALQRAVPLVAAPEWLTREIAAKRSQGRQMTVEECVEVAEFDLDGRATDPLVWSRMLQGGIDEGSRNASLTRLAGYLLRRYVAVDLTVELLHLVNDHCCRPSLSRGELDEIIESMAGMELQRREGMGW
jgi:hypothetical protein